MSKNKVLLITVRADYGGGPKHVDLIINNLSEVFNIYLACPDDAPYYLDWKYSKKVKGIFLLPHRKFDFVKFLKLILFCFKRNITIVHSHGKGAGVYSRLLKFFLYNLKVIHTFHGVHVQEYGQLKKKIYLFYEQILARFTNKFINVSAGEKNECLKYRFFPPEKSVVIYNAIKALPKRSTPRPLELAGKLVITTISRFDFPKNMYLAFEIAKRFRNDVNIVFLWIGDGNDKADLEILAQKENLTNILFTGFTTEIDTYLNWSDIYLSTSKWEGLPYALIEAASLGIPIVASDVTGNNEIVEHRTSGYLYSLHSAEAATQYLRELVTDASAYAAMSQAIQNTFQQKFILSAMIESLEKVYASI